MWITMLLCAYAAAATVTSSWGRDSDNVMRQDWFSKRVDGSSPQFPQQDLRGIRDGLETNGIFSRPRRLMGILRCYGWGPGCSSTVSHARRPPKSRLSQVPADRLSTKSQRPETSQRKSISEIRSRKMTSRFHPPFVFTSGGSWGATGRKRRLQSQRRYTASDKRIDFLKQILRDMLDELDDDDVRRSAPDAGDDDARKRHVAASDKYVTRLTQHTGMSQVVPT